MKKTLFLLAFTTCTTLLTHAQSTDTTSDPGYTASAKGPASQAKNPAFPAKDPVSPTQRAARQLMTLQKQLNLNQDQVIQLRMVLLNLNVSLDSLRSSPSGDKKADNQARRAISQDADGKIYAVLTIDQQAAYAKWKQDQQLKRQLGRAAKKTPTDSTGTSPQHP